jgi:hypothetical protein
MSSVIIAGNTSGTITLDAPNVAGTTTLTLPTTSGTVMVNGPAFSAYLAANQSVTSTVITKITLNTETFDTNNNFDNATNYRFTPTVAGYYQINAGAQSQATGMSAMVLTIYRNGTAYKTQTSALGGTPAFVSMSISDVIYLNGSTDYIELYGQVNGTSPLLSGGITVTFMSGVLVRSA